MTSKRQRRQRALALEIARLERRLARMERQSTRLSWARVAVFAGGLLLTLLAYRLWRAEAVSWSVLALTLLAFVALVVRHRRLRRGMRRHRFWQQLKTAQRARMQLDWARIPLRDAAAAAGREHAFEADLDVSGPRSLRHLIDIAVSTGGSARLRDWLLCEEPDPGVIRRRQALVGELVPMDGFRDRLALAGAMVAADPSSSWDGERLLDWLDRHIAGRSLVPGLLVLGGLAVANVGLLAAHLLAGAPAFWLVPFSLYLALYLYQHRDFQELFEDAEQLQFGLARFRAVLLYLERFPFRPGSGVAQLCAPFRRVAGRPSRELSRVNWLAAAAALQRNQIPWVLINIAVPWDLFFADRLQRCMRLLRERLPAWLDTWSELEALNALANFGYLNPHYATPEILEAGAAPAPMLAATGLGHPLLADRLRVCNDFTVAGAGSIAIVTGSNMSGKSTFLRTVGLNLVLAFAGGPVAASRLRVQPCRLFSCIQIADSVTDGISYFYAEVRRLKELLLRLRREQSLPLLFLIDEIFRGTNNRERLIGTRAYVAALAGGHGAGIISTHDLELVQLAASTSSIVNHHFREDIDGGRMVFDYRLRPGPCPTTNALAIMRMEGLPVPAGVEPGERPAGRG